MKKITFLVLFIAIIIGSFCSYSFAQTATQEQEKTPQQLAADAQAAVNALLQMVLSLRQENATLRNKVDILQGQVDNFGQQVELAKQDLEKLKVSNTQLGQNIESVADENKKLRILLRRVLLWLDEEEALREDISQAIGNNEEDGEEDDEDD